MSFVNIFIVVLSLILSGCSSQPDSNTIQKDIIQKNITSTGPVSIQPVDAVKGTILNLNTDGSLINDTEIRWIVDGVPHESSQRTRFDTSRLRKGDTVKAVIIKGDEEFTSNFITIGNTAPTIINAKLLPEVPSSVSTFTAQVNANDIDSDLISYNYRWLVNDQYRGNDSFLETELQRGDVVTVEISPTDREDSGKSVTLTSEVFNSLPIVSESTPVIEGNIYKHRIDVSDPDGDQLKFTLKKGPEGMSVNQSGELNWEIKSDASGDHDIEVLVNDNHGGEILIPISTSISF